MLDIVKRKSEYGEKTPVNQLLTGGGVVTTLDLRFSNLNDKFSLISLIDYGMADRNIGVFHSLFGGATYERE